MSMIPKMARLLDEIAAKGGAWYEGLPFQAPTFRALANRGLIEIAQCQTDVCGRLVYKGALKGRVVSR